MRRLLGMIVALALLVGCSADNRTKGQGKSKGVVGISVLTMTNPFFKVIADNLAEELRPHGYEVIAVSGDHDIAKQQKQVQDFLVKKVAAIVLCPCDSKAIGPVIKAANDQGVPVFTADIASLANEGKVVCHIATDNYLGGKQAADAMIEALGESGGKVVILDYKNAESCLERTRGFKEVLDAYNAKRERGKIKIVAELPGDGKRDEGYKKAQDAIEAHPDLAGIFAINDPSALGARAALEKADKADQVKIIGFDGQPEGKKAIKEGKIYADPVQYPDKIGRETGRMILRYFTGEKVPETLPIAPSLYRKADGEQDESLK